MMVDDTHSACYSSSTLSYWLANLRTIIVKQLSEEHIKSKRINDGNSIHVHNAFYKYASDNNWNLLFHQNQLKDIFYELANLEENDLSRIYDSFRQRYQEEACSYVVQCFRDAVDSLIKKTGVNVGTDNAPSFIISNEQYPEFSKEIQNLFREIGINELSFWSIVTLNDDEILSVQDSFLKHIESFVLYGLYFQKKIIKGEEVEREAVEGKSNNSMDDQEKKLLALSKVC